VRGTNRAVAVGAIIAAAGLMTVMSATPAAGLNPATDVSISTAVSAPSTLSSCAGSGAASAAIRTAVDGLDDVWRSAASTRGLSAFVLADMGSPSSPVVSHPTTFVFAGTAVTVNVSLRDVPTSQVPGFGGPAGGTGVGTLAGVNLNGPTVGVSSSRTMQDCAPYPASLYGANAASQAPMWNENAGNGSSLNGVLFEFSTPVQAFGAWWGDLETRPSTGGSGGGGTPGWVKLFDAAGVVIWEGPVPADEGAASDVQCGGSSSDTDLVGCGNSSTRWIGFSLPAGEMVARMLVTVGDDDSCAQTVASQCDGLTEHLGFVGATLAVTVDGEPIVTTTTSTSSTTTTTTVDDTTTTTTVDDTTTTTTVDDTTTTTTVDDTTTTTTTVDDTTTTTTVDDTTTTTTVDDTTTTTTVDDTTTTTTTVDDTTTTTTVDDTTTTTTVDDTTTTTTVDDTTTTTTVDDTTTTTTVDDTTTTTTVDDTTTTTTVDDTTTTTTVDDTTTTTEPSATSTDAPATTVDTATTTGPTATTAATAPATAQLDTTTTAAATTISDHVRSAPPAATAAPTSAVTPMIQVGQGPVTGAASSQTGGAGLFLIFAGTAMTVIGAARRRT
jgi:hypothetical protein